MRIRNLKPSHRQRYPISKLSCPAAGAAYRLTDLGLKRDLVAGGKGTWCYRPYSVVSREAVTYILGPGYAYIDTGYTLAVDTGYAPAIDPGPPPPFDYSHPPFKPPFSTSRSVLSCYYHA
ncbi:hypothetical protein ACRALDRAFT_2027056 [Sodiomyces alcalophilus JCM 7366]|uniref:uncharacterized protein n=1 Tax=Sodiomyces alcalophilus JCM 7366 TaxID=591952 RepID=UPI0039B64DA5